MVDCIFCDKEKIKQEILFTSFEEPSLSISKVDFGANFFTEVGLNILALGHIIMISNAHYGCFAEMPDELYEEYERFRDRSQLIVESKFDVGLYSRMGWLGEEC